jgi:FHA domain
MSDKREEPTRPWKSGGVGLGDAGPDGVTRPDSPSSGAGGRREAPSSSGDPKTIPVGAQVTPNVAEAFDPMRDPVVGWLVVVAGTGKGTHRPLGIGQNVIGRGDDARVKLIYGAALKLMEGATQVIDVGLESHTDAAVGRKHCIITYDNRSRKFFIQNSPDSTNLTYIKGMVEPLMVPRELNAFDRIQMGNTELMFVPLCHQATDESAGFDWKDT